MKTFRVGAQASIRQLVGVQARRQIFNPRFLQSQIQPTFRTRPQTQLQVRAIHSLPRRPFTTRFSQLRSRTARRWKSEDATLESKPDSQLSLSQRLKKMSREYGWAAVYLYFALSALDFPFCFLAVKWLGTDTIGHWEHVITSYVKGMLQWPMSSAGQAVGDAIDNNAHDAMPAQGGKRLLEEDPSAVSVTDHGYKEALQANSGSDASIWTQLALAYAIHKSFIFVRVPLTAAILPKVVKTLRGWGWNIGRPSRKAIQGAGKSSGKTGVNTKGSGVKPDD